MRTRVTLLVVCLLAAAVAVVRADRYEETPLRRSFAMFPLHMGQWQSTSQAPLSDDVLKVLGVDDYMTRIYQQGTRAGVGLYVGYWKSQRQGDTMHSPQNCLPGAGWEPESQSVMQIADPRNAAAPAVPINRYVIRKGLDRQLVFYWYASHGRIVASEYWSKFYLIADAIRLNRTDAALVRVITPITGDSAAAERDAEARALQFTNELIPQLSTYLPS